MLFGMNPRPAPLRPRTDIEASRRQMYLLLASLACLSQLAVTALDLVRGGLAWPPPHGEAVFGALVCGSLIALLRRRRIPLLWIDYGVLAAASVGVAFELLIAFVSPDALLPRLYFIGVFLFVAAFSILPVRLAALYSVVLYAVFVVLTLKKAGDPTLLIEVALIVLLIAHLSVFGQRVNAERTEARIFQVLAETDALTGLTNRRAMYPRLEQVPLSGARTSSAALLLDIDHFKQVNDVYGHPTGDLVLQCFAAALQAAVRPGDVVARWGGEEFLILLSGVDEDSALDAACRILEAVRRCAMPAGLRITASCGVAHARQMASAAEWLSQVDALLYAAKHAGRDRAVQRAAVQREDGRAEVLPN